MSMRPAVAAALSAVDTEDAGEAAAVCGAAEALPAPAGSGAGALEGVAAGGERAAEFGLVVDTTEPGKRPEPQRGIFAGMPGALAAGVAAAHVGLLETAGGD